MNAIDAWRAGVFPYFAHSLSHLTSTEADNLDAFHGAVRDAVHCHCGNADGPRVIRFVCEEVVEA